MVADPVRVPTLFRFLALLLVLGCVACSKTYIPNTDVEDTN